MLQNLRPLDILACNSASNILKVATKEHWADIQGKALRLTAECRVNLFLAIYVTF